MSTLPAPQADDVAGLVVPVRTLCEFAARAGDIDRRFGPSSSLELGLEGHRLITARRDAARRAEVWLTWTHGELTVRGRADGLDEAAGILEEVKTHRGPVDRLPASRRLLHRAQARAYAAMACRQLGRSAITVRLTYLDVDTGRETVIDESCDARGLDDALTGMAERYLVWARSEAVHRTVRNDALAVLAFSHAAFRTGQRALAAQVYRTTTAGQRLMAQACTGIGKTVGTLFPMLKAMPVAGLERIFFLTAKRSGQQAPLDALRALGAGTDRLPLRVVQLLARDQACERPGRACHGESCDLARGFHDRLPAARDACVSTPMRDAPDLRRVAADHGICPYYLSQEMAGWADVVIADYNHFFDGRAMLAGHAAAHDGRIGLLVDEAHNLVDRARRMYSAELGRPDLDRAALAASGPARQALARLCRVWPDMAAPGVPTACIAPLQEACRVIEQALAAGIVGAVERGAIDATVAIDVTDPDPVLAAWFAMRSFLRLAEAFGPHSLFESTTATKGGPVLRIRNVVPAPFLAPRFALAHAVVLFSGTLTPGQFEVDLLGLPTDTGFIDVDSPFHADQLTVHHVPISTRYRDRGRSLDPICRLIADQFDAVRGNYLAFFSSFAYLDEIHAAFVRRHPEIPAWRQVRAMSATDRAGFLARFDAGSGATAGAAFGAVAVPGGVAFAVLGGSFAEGVDLPGGRLAGVFIATLGLPAIEAGNEAVRERLDAMFGSGFDYTYLVPGMRKVVQAAGRLVRSPSDRGVVHLIDPRYGRREVQALLPAWWPAPTPTATRPA